MPQDLSPQEHGRMLRRRFIPLYIASLALMFHTFVIAYLNSSFLEQFIPAEGVGTLYIITSALTILCSLVMSRVLHKVGNFKLMLSLLFINGLSVFGLAYAESLQSALPLMAAHLILVPLIIFNLDVFMEEHIGNNEGTTGTRRGLLLTLTSAVGAISPFLSSELVTLGGGDFKYAYIASALALLPIVVVLLLYFNDFQDPPYRDIQMLEALRGFWIKKDIRSVFCIHFTLQMFFMCMIVFTPLYLTQHIGLSWEAFGIIMLFGQLAYVLLEYPIGYVADNYIGEKEMMALGLLIMSVSTAWIAFVATPNVVLWALIMFITRVGASFVEVTSETHFFKQTNSSDTQIISFFRIGRPLAYLAGALVASLSLLYVPFNLLFVVFGFLMIPAMFMTFNIVDSK